MNDQDPDKIDPFVIDTDSGNTMFSKWLRRVDVAWGVGTPATTFIIARPKGQKIFDPWQSPLGILYQAITNACKKGHPRMVEWQPLREGSAGKGAALQMPQEAYLMQGAVLEHNKKRYFGQHGAPKGWGTNPPVILALSGGVGRKLADTLLERNTAFNGDPLDFERRFVNGDPVDPRFGRYFNFYQAGHDPRLSSHESQPTKTSSFGAEGTFSDRSGGGSGDGKLKGFEFHIAKEHAAMTADFSGNSVDMIKSKWRYWQETLYHPTEIEQAHLLGGCFPASAILYAFDGHNRDWITDEVRQKAVNAVQASVPAVPPPAAPKTSFGGFGAAPQQRFTPEADEPDNRDPFGAPPTEAVTASFTGGASLPPAPPPASDSWGQAPAPQTDVTVPPVPATPEPRPAAAPIASFGPAATPAAPTGVSAADKIANLLASRKAVTK
jgi:hypothetical protein